MVPTSGSPTTGATRPPRSPIDGGSWTACVHLTVSSRVIPAGAPPRPRHVEVHEIGAVPLEVHAFARRVRRDQAAHGMLVWRRVEGAPYPLAVLIGHPR